MTNPEELSPEQIRRNELTRQWWFYCEEHQKELAVIPTFREYLALLNIQL